MEFTLVTACVDILTALPLATSGLHGHFAVLQLQSKDYAQEGCAVLFMFQHTPGVRSGHSDLITTFISI